MKVEYLLYWFSPKHPLNGQDERILANSKESENNLINLALYNWKDLLRPGTDSNHKQVCRTWWPCRSSSAWWGGHPPATKPPGTGDLLRNWLDKGFSTTEVCMNMKLTLLKCHIVLSLSYCIVRPFRIQGRGTKIPLNMDYKRKYCQDFLCIFK